MNDFRRKHSARGTWNGRVRKHFAWIGSHSEQKPMNRVWGHNFIPVCNKLNTCTLFALDIWSSNFFFIFLFLGKMAMCSSGRGISSLVLISSLLFGSQSFAGKTSRRFIGLPESGERVNYSNARENNKTLIIRHNLPVSDKIYLSFSTKCFDPLKK